MGFKSFIESELSYDFISSASAMEIWDQYYKPRIGSDDFYFIMKSDPTTNKGKPFTIEEMSNIAVGKFTKTLLKWYERGLISILYGTALFRGEYDNETVGHTLRRFLEVSKYLSPKQRDLNAYAGPSELASAVEGAINTAERERGREKAQQESHIWYEDATWLVVSPQSHFASRYFACYTKKHEGNSWCTTWDNPSYYSKYTSNGDLYMCMNKKNQEDSYQIYLPDGNADEEYAQAVSATYSDKVSEGTEIQSHIPKDLLDIFKSRLNIDLSDDIVLYTANFHSEREDEEEHEPEHGYSIYFSGEHSIENGVVKGVIHGTVIEVTREWDRDEGDYEGWGASEVIGSDSLTYEAGRFNYKDSDYSMLEFESVNFTEHGIYIILSEGLDRLISDIKGQAPNNYNEDGYDYSFDIRQALLAAAGLSRDELRRAHAQTDITFAVVLSVENIAHNDDFVSEVVSMLEKHAPAAESSGGQEAPVWAEPGYLSYRGEDYSAVVVGTNNSGDLADALLNKGFAIHVGDEDSLKKLSHYPEQEAKDRQIKFDEAWASLRARAKRHHEEIVSSKRKAHKK